MAGDRPGARPPSPSAYTVTVRYELHLPKSVPGLLPAVQESVALHTRKEMDDLAAYLAECVELEEMPEVVSL